MTWHPYHKHKYSQQTGPMTALQEQPHPGHPVAAEPAVPAFPIRGSKMGTIGERHTVPTLPRHHAVRHVGLIRVFFSNYAVNKQQSVIFFLLFAFRGTGVALTMAFNAMVATSSASSASAVAFVVPSYDPECCKTSTFGAMCLSPVALRSGTVKANATIRASAAEVTPISSCIALQLGFDGARRSFYIGSQASHGWNSGRRCNNGIWSACVALTGPGGDGAATTAKEADVLLDRADNLTKNDSPQRFGGGLKNAGSTAKQAGSAASSNVEDIADAAVKSARDNLNRAKASFGDLMGKGNSKVRGKISDASTSTSNQTFQLGDASIVVNVAKMNASTAVDNAKDALSVLGDKLTGNDANNEASNVQSKASSAISGAKSNLPSIPFSSREEGRPEVLDACRALKT
nr:uncharacterized protein LOC112275349 [Physcomitrium patens]|eukprot:XP_024361422.1 uncharacterized protein LOC112275349 [Physcomitrella patens]